MDGRALVSLISLVILSLLFLYAVLCAARTYTADRWARLSEDETPRRWSDWYPGLARRLAVGSVVILTILALAVTAASWSLSSRPLRALLHRLESIGTVRAKEARSAPASVSVAAASATPPARPLFVWNGRVTEAPRRPERRSPDPARERVSLVRDEKPARGKRGASRGERFERVARVDRASAGRVERAGIQRVLRPDRAARTERPERVARLERVERAERPQRTERPERVTRHGR